MNLELQVTSLELSKKLRELAVSQKSYFHWYYSVYTEEDFKWRLMQHHRLDIKEKHNDDNVISAFTVAELGELLPDMFATCRNEDGEWMGAWDESKWNILEKINSYDKTEANCRAKILIYLIENDLWKPNHE